MPESSSVTQNGGRQKWGVRSIKLDIASGEK